MNMTNFRSYKTSIVIPVYKKWSLCNRLLEGLEKNELGNIDEVVVVDDDSKDPDTDSGLIEWSKKDSLRIFTAVMTKNVGFTLASNIGLEYCSRGFSERRIVFLISSDVIVNGRFIEQAADILFSPKRALVGNRHIAFDSGWNNFDGKIFDYLEGFFLGCTSDGWRDLDYFDEKYAPLDFEDVDLSTKAKAKGYKLISLNNPNIQHEGAGTYGYTEERRAITERNREYFRKKWLEK